MNTPLQTQTIVTPEGKYSLLLLPGEPADVSEAEANFAEKNAKPGLTGDGPMFWLGYDAYWNRVPLGEMTCAEEAAGWRAAWRDARAYRQAEMAVYA